MSDFIAGPGSGAGDDGTGMWNGPPPILLAALGAAALIAITVVAVAFAVGKSSGAAVTPTPNNGASVAADGSVQLKVIVEGGGIGQIQIDPRGVTCSQTCDHSFPTGTRLTVTATASKGSSFSGWGEACGGRGRCSITMDHERTLRVTFEGSSSASCTDVTSDDPRCQPDEEAPAKPRSDCADGRDNDGDGLTDSAQDPGCDKGNEAADATVPDTKTTPQEVTPAPPPATSTVGDDCSDGIDNDDDGLTDSAQDPNCVGGTTESGSPIAPATGGTTTTTPRTGRGAQPSGSDCADKRDNDGDGLIDSAQDPGCDKGGSEADE